MKKLIASASIAAASAVGAFGLLGIGAISASASGSPAPGTVAAAVCTSLSGSTNANAAPTSAADASEQAAIAAFNTADTTTLPNALENYASTLVAFVNGVDTHAPNQNVLLSTFQAAANAFTTALSQWSSALSARDNATHADTVQDVTGTVLTSLSVAFGCVSPVSQ